MDIDRRTWLKLTAATTAFGFDLTPATARAHTLKIEETSQTRSICPYCSVSCGVILHTRGDGKNTCRQVVHVEGDPDHPVNRGTLCAKGASLEHYVQNDRRLRHPMVREPGASEWKPISWDEAVERIARRLKDARDASFIERDTSGRTVNRWEDVAFIGGCTDSNELNYLLQKVARSMGVCYLEQQSRI